MTTQTEPATFSHYKFQATMASYYKKERARSEQCLGDILDTILGSGSEVQMVDAIIQRLTEHYTRADGETPNAKENGK